MSPLEDGAGSGAGTASGKQGARVLAGAAETENRYAVIELAATRGDGPPRHRHQMEDETIVVLDGRLIVALDDRLRLITNGECIVLPRGRDHTYRVDSEQACFLIIVVPARLEASYLNGVWHGNNLERFVAVAAGYGIEVTGPALEADSIRGVGD